MSSQSNANYIPHLSHVLRRANHHYSTLAAQIRSSIQSTRHAQKRAAALKLAINLKKAHACDPTEVSRIPLPILDAHVSPPPAPTVGLSLAVVGREREMAHMAATQPPAYDQPPVADMLPQEVRSKVPRRPPTVAWHPRSTVVTLSQMSSQDPPQLQLTLGPEPASLRLSWGPDITSALSLASSSASGSSSGPKTPFDQDPEVPLSIRTKRKSSDICGVNRDADSSPEKRPKYERKELQWVQSRCSANEFHLSRITQVNEVPNP